MKVVILAGGLGTRLSEETSDRPKPMVEIGGKPILWHIMKIYAAYGITDFIVCCGYKGYVIKEYFANYALHSSDVTFDFSNDSVEVHKNNKEPWRVTLIDTGADSMTGGRLKRVSDFVQDESFFGFTYGDGLTNVNIDHVISFHKSHKKKATVVAAQPPGRFGSLEVINNQVKRFQEKPIGDGGRINGGFFILSPDVLELISGDDCIWEHEPLEILTQTEELMAFDHRGFWQPMDTLRDKNALEKLWREGNAPWKVWSEPN